MKCFVVNPYGLNYFENVIPVYLQRSILEKKSKLFGMIDEDSRQIVGCAVCALEMLEIQLEWLYIDPKYRRRGYATRLLSFMVESVQEEDFVMNMFCVYDDRELPADMGYFLKDRMFLESESTLHIWKFNDSDVILPDKMKERLNRGIIYSLSDLSKEEKRACCGFLDAVESLSDLNTYDEHFSLIELKNGKMSGAILCRKINDKIEISWVQVINDAPFTFLSLISELQQKVHRKYKNKDVIYIVAAITDTSRALLKKLVPNAKQIKVKRAELPI